MNTNEFETVLKNIAEIERKIEKYYQILKIENELDFILKGTYVLQDDIDNIMSGNY